MFTLDPENKTIFYYEQWMEFGKTITALRELRKISKLHYCVGVSFYKKQRFSHS